MLLKKTKKPKALIHTMKRKSVVIIEDHKLLREMYKEVFAGHTKIQIIGEAGDVETGVETVTNLKPDLVLLDINLPPGNGCDVVPLIKSASPNTKIICISMHSHPVYAKKMINAGVCGYVTKNSSRSEMFVALEEVLKGNIFLCLEMKESIVRNHLTENYNLCREAQISLREKQIAGLIKEGLASKEIADTLCLSVKTIEAHRNNMYKKLKVKNSSSLIKRMNHSLILNE